MKRYFQLALILTVAMVIYSTDGHAFKSMESTQKPGTAASMDERFISGMVIETMNSGGYSYIHIERNSKKLWVAVSETKVTVGKVMTFHSGLVMTDFKSKTLNRTFKSIVFSTGVVRESEFQAGKSSDSSSPVAAPKEKIKVGKASGANAYTVAELYEKRQSLDKNKVVLRGKVVKVSPGIMKSNWIHIQDGTGTAKDRNNDIIVTTQDLPSVGDEVTASGTVVNDLNLGSGYKFDVLIEEAKIEK